MSEWLHNLILIEQSSGSALDPVAAFERTCAPRLEPSGDLLAALLLNGLCLIRGARFLNLNVNDV
jgi:hypothetical protein